MATRLLGLRRRRYYNGPISEQYNVSRRPCRIGVRRLTKVLDRRTEDELRAYITAPFLLPNISSTELDQLLALYPANVSAGSPFDTGSANAVSPQYKRIAALHGDLVFQGPRRFFLQQRAGKQPVWAFRE